MIKHIYHVVIKIMFYFIHTIQVVTETPQHNIFYEILLQSKSFKKATMVYELHIFFWTNNTVLSSPL